MTRRPRKHKPTLASVLSRELAYIVLAIEAWRARWPKKGRK